ncbi:MAG TPA: hypothetical protein VGP72_31300 [Planctomycetota bacterium]|jgi:hypothetical protein
MTAQSECAARIETLSARQIVNRLGRLRNTLNRKCIERSNDGWNTASFDPNRLLATCKHIRLKPGMKLIAYQFRACSNGNGLVLALPAERQIPSPVSLGDGLLPRRLPKWMDRCIAHHIEGDGSPESYFEASILIRELSELGAVWHGCSWSEHAVVLSDEDVPAFKWEWRHARPADWRPAFQRNASGTSISFWTYTGYERERVIRFEDQFTDQYDFATEAGAVAEGPGGYIH